MAIMIDPKPEYKGEGLVWESLSKNLPADVVVYTHREVVNGDECDFALLIKDRGILIIEVKGWAAKYIFDVTNSGNVVLTNDSPEEKKTQGSPRIQARKYRFQWLNFIQDRLGFSPLVLHMVCYPFISEKDYHYTRLDTLSDTNITLFAEDINSPVKLGQKIDSWFGIKKRIASTVFDETHMRMVRQLLEPSFHVNNTTNSFTSDAYSKLLIFGRDITSKDEDSLIEAYFSGTKIIAFLQHVEEIERLSKRIQYELEKRKLTAGKGNIMLADPEEKHIAIWEEGSKSFKIFNFEIYLQEGISGLNEDIVITEGKVGLNEDNILQILNKTTDFNYEQFCVEHADASANILVKAGAGTGKTYSMVSRISFLCYAQNSSIYNLIDDIAMVTFTNDAADNMKKRLKQSFMNYYLLTKKSRFLHNIESVDIMQISTIHKFAKSIIQASSFEFGLGHNFSITSSIYAKEQIYEKHLDAYLVQKLEQDQNFYRKLRMPVRKFRKLLINFAKQLYDKSCDIKEIPPEEYGFFEELPFFNEVISEVIIPAENEYSLQITSKNKIDLKECMILLSKAVNGSFKEKCDLKYQYLFVDEFQDTDDVQIDSILKLQEIISGLKLFVVGDIKQSIYRFRGATDSAFSRIRKASSNWKEFSLTTNYRSDNRLLKKFDKIFTDMGRKGYLKFIPSIDSIESTITAFMQEMEKKKKIEYSGDNDGDQMEKLFQEITNQKTVIETYEENGLLTDVEKTIAILVRENWQIENILQESRIRGVYIETEIGGNLYQLSPAIDLYKLVLALMNPKDPVILYNFILSNYIHINMDIQGIHGLNKEEKAIELIKAINAFLSENGEFTWEELVKDLKVKPVLVLLRDIYETLQPWQKYSADETGQRFYKANYELVLEKIIKAYSVDYLTLNVMANSLQINILTKQEELARNVAGESKGIKIICTTIHKSKGLEYGTVILPYTNADISSMSKSPLDVVYTNHKLAYGMRIDGPIRYYNTNYDMTEERSQRIQEESRVFYVALTRAIRNVVWLKDIDSNSPVSWQQMMEA